MARLGFGPGALLYAVFTWCSLSFVTAAITNRTIDDTFGDSQIGQLVAYLPTTTGVWKDETCLDCAINPSILFAQNGTYTAATYHPELGSISATMQFNGTAIYVFFILANNAGNGITTLTEANFTLDGNTPQTYTHVPDLTTTALEFNSLVFAQTNLVNTQHTLVISTSGVNTSVYVNFDYAIYTHDDTVLPSSTPSSPTLLTDAASPTSSLSTSSSTKKPATATKKSSNPSKSASLEDNAAGKSSISAGAVAGGVIAGLLFIALLVFIFFCRRRRTLRKSRDETNGYIPPLMAEMEPQIDQRGATIAPSASQGSLNSPPVRRPETFSNSQERRSQLNAPSSPWSMPLTDRPPVSPSDNESAYGGYVSATPIDTPTLSNSDATPSNMFYGYEKGRRVPLRLVNGYDSASSPAKSRPPSFAPFANIPANQPDTRRNTIEDVRRARQQELGRRLQAVKQEMNELSSDLNSTEKGGRHRSVARSCSLKRAQQLGLANEDEMSVEELRELLRTMREQVVYLQEHQRSAWAQGLSDDPPPGYTPARMTGRYSQPPSISPVS